MKCVYAVFLQRLALALGAGLMRGATAFAHSDQPLTPHDLWLSFNGDPWVLLGLVLSGGLYFLGVRRLWQASSTGAGIRQWEVVAFWVGWFFLSVALVSPLDLLGEVLFSVHMIQHEVLMLIAAPLLVLGRPLAAFLWALPLSWRRVIGRSAKGRGLQGTWRALIYPWAAWAIHGAVLWIWHAPGFFQAALASDLIHTLQHVSFLFSALLFWWALVRGQQGTIGFGAAILYIFTTAIHTSLLGALLTFAPTVWFPAYAETTLSWGLTPLEDQQLGGLIMWVPAGLVYIFAALAFLALCLRESEARAQKRESYALVKR